MKAAFAKGDTVRVFGSQKLGTVENITAYGWVDVRLGQKIRTFHPTSLVQSVKPIKITPEMINQERKPTRKAALIYIRFAGKARTEDKAWEIIQNLVPYFAIEHFFDRVQAMSSCYSD